MGWDSHMRVLTIANFFPPYRTGGGEVAAYYSCLGMRRRGVECAVLSIYTRQPAVERRYRIAGIPVHQVYRRERRSALRDLFSPWVYRRVMEEIAGFKPDLIHTHNVSGASLAPFLAAERAGVPVVATLHDHWLLCPNNMLYQKDGAPCDPAVAVTRGQCARCFREYDFWANVPYRRHVFQRLTRHVDTFLVPSQYLIEQHVRAGYRRERLQLLRLGMPFADPSIAHPSHHLEEVLHNVGRERTLLFAGGLNVIKGAQVLIDALDEVVRRVPGFRLLVAGEALPVYASRLQRFGGWVRLLGRVPFRDMHTLYSAAELTAVPSTCQENFPLVAAESVAMGTPVVGTGHGGIPEIVRDEETGYLVPPGDPQALAERVIAHFEKPAPARREMRQRSVQHGRDLLAWDRHLDALGDVYRRVA
jgi:glycosyltransferase involved in cell wall biosynthesis